MYNSHNFTNKKNSRYERIIARPYRSGMRETLSRINILEQITPLMTVADRMMNI
jgi:hypothetical protein